MAEKKTLFIVFLCDEWLSNNSRVFKGAYGSLDGAIDAVVENNYFEDEDFYDVGDEDDWYCLTDEEQQEIKSETIREALLESRQTQFGSEYNYIIEECTIGEWQ